MTAAILIALAALLALAGAASDVATRRLPNLLVAALAVAAIAGAFALGGLPVLGSGALHAVIALLVGLGLFAAGAVGAGDAKFYTACAFAVPLGSALTMLGWLSVAGLVLFMAMLVANRGLKRADADGNRVSWTLPYGLPIAIGFVMTVKPWEAFA